MPVVSFKAFRSVIGEPPFNIAINGDPVVIPEGNQLAQPEGACQRARLMGDPFHHATIAKEDVGVMVNDFMSRTIELSPQNLFSQSHPHTIGDALP